MYLVSLLGSSVWSCRGEGGSSTDRDAQAPPPRPNLQLPLHISIAEKEYLTKSAAKPGMIVLPSGLQVSPMMFLTPHSNLTHPLISTHVNQPISTVWFPRAPAIGKSSFLPIGSVDNLKRRQYVWCIIQARRSEERYLRRRIKVAVMSL